MEEQARQQGMETGDDRGYGANGGDGSSCLPASASIKSRPALETVGLYRDVGSSRIWRQVRSFWRGDYLMYGHPFDVLDSTTPGGSTLLWNCWIELKINRHV